MSIISKYEDMSFHIYEINIQDDKLIGSTPTTQNLSHMTQHARKGPEMLYFIRLHVFTISNVIFRYNIVNMMNLLYPC